MDRVGGGCVCVWGVTERMSPVLKALTLKKTWQWEYGLPPHWILSHGRWFPQLQKAGLGVRCPKHLPEWVLVSLSLLVPLQVAPAAHLFIHLTSFSRRSYYFLQLPLPEPDSYTGVQARTTVTAVEVSLDVVGAKSDGPLLAGLPCADWLSCCIQPGGLGRWIVYGEHGKKWCSLFPFPWHDFVLGMTASVHHQKTIVHSDWACVWYPTR